jgi:hypothetical protein
MLSTPDAANDRRTLIVRGTARTPTAFRSGLSLVIALCWLAAGPAAAAPQSANPAGDLLAAARDSLLAAQAQSEGGGIAWRSVLQAPNFQTDIDVGTAGIGNAALDAYAASGDQRDLSMAIGAGRWLLSAQRAGGGWPDFDNPPGKVPPGPSRRAFTTLDDGAAGQALFMHRLYLASGDPAFLASARAAAGWLVRTAHAVEGQRCPEQACYWYWSYPLPEPRDPVLLGLGSGVAGIVEALADLSGRLDEPRLLTYAKAGAAYLEQQIAADGSVPLVKGGRTAGTGLYEGAAGVAHAFLALYRATGERRWLADAERCLGWVARTAAHGPGGLRWPQSVGAEGDPSVHTGQAWGSAGIGWVALQAYHVTKRPRYRDLALAAGQSLLATRHHNERGTWWPETDGQRDVYTSLDLGVAGVAYFLHDLDVEFQEPAFAAVATDAARWLQSRALTDERGAPVWAVSECDGCGGASQTGENSRHWGSAGLLSLAARLGGGRSDMPRDVPSIP